MSETPDAQAIAVLVATGFEERHLTLTQRTLIGVGRAVAVVSAEDGLVQGWHDGTWGHHFMADINLSEALSTDYVGLIIPGGVRSATKLNAKPHAKRLVKAFIETGKPTGLYGDAVTVLEASEAAAARRISGPEELREALEQAGAQWVEGEMVVDRQLLSCPEGIDFAVFLTAFQELLVPGADAAEAPTPNKTAPIQPAPVV